tara:strand:- start:645 stop:1262 length:618 start_codon:yes stop_codon:yes gene_type:complete
MSRFDLNTGDLLLFDYHGGGFFGVFTGLIKYFTKSKYSHIAMVLKDPEFLHPSLKGYYVWESSWEGKPDPQDGKIKLGVQITPFEEIYNTYKETGSSIYLRKVNCKKEMFNIKNLSDIHKVVYQKPYDIIPTDWIEAIFRKDDHPKKIDRFWCAALVGYIYTKCGILEKNTDWSVLRPSDFSIQSKNILKFNIDCNLENQETKIL